MITFLSNLLKRFEIRISLILFLFLFLQVTALQNDTPLAPDSPDSPDSPYSPAMVEAEKNITFKSPMDPFLYKTSQLTRREAGRLWNQTKEADIFLEWYILQLKSFVSEDSVRFSAFEETMDSLGLDLTMISEFVESEVSYNKVLAAKLRAAKLFFGKLSRAVKNLRSSGDIELRIRILLHEIIELNCMALALQNSYGYLDLSIDGVSNKLLRLWNKITLCVSKFKLISKVLMDIRFMFEDHAIEAKRALQSLVILIPETERERIYY